VQAGNSTLSASDRTAIQEEVTALTSEIDAIASSTNFNGVKLLDGSNTEVDFQVGVDASDALSVALESSSAADLGISGSNGANKFTSGRIVLGATQSIATDAIKLNGQDFLHTTLATTSGTTNGASLIAAGINLQTAKHGVVADAFNKVAGASMGADFAMTATFTISTEGVSETIAIQSSMSDLVTTINQQVQGITATQGDGNSLILSNDDGKSIILGGDSEIVGITAGTYEGMYSLENTDGSHVKIELGNVANGYVQAATATAANMNLVGLNESHSSTTTKGFSVTTTTLALTDDIRINGVQVGATTVNSAKVKADAVNAISDQTGVTANATTTLLLDLDFDIDMSATNFIVNNQAINVLNDNSVKEVASAINTANVGVVASATSTGLLKLVDTGGNNITIESTLTTYVTTATDADNIALTLDQTIIASGNLVLTSEDGGVIKLTDNTIANSGLAKLGLEGQSEEQEASSGGVNVSTLSGATTALSNIDDAIETLSTFRASFGAVENRIDAKINNLTTLKVNTQAAQSRIEDADFAAETTNMTKAQILSQAATSMLAQANASKQNLLALLQG
jgi:flagellin